MRTKLWMAVVLVVLTACEQQQNDAATMDVEFVVSGWTMEVEPMTRALESDGQEMTDLWIFDYVGEQCVQTVHQTPADDNFGNPTIPLTYDEHHIYFVASRGDSPTVDATGHIIRWNIPKDTFWRDYQVRVGPSSSTQYAVALDRVATRLRIEVNDAVPASISTLSVTPSVWYYGLDYLTGAAVDEQLNRERSVTVPASYAGTSGSLTISIFGLSGAEEWSTDLTVSATDAEGNPLGSVNLSGAPFLRNRTTTYSGNLFGTNRAMSISLSDGWADALQASW